MNTLNKVLFTALAFALFLLVSYTNPKVTLEGKEGQVLNSQITAKKLDSQAQILASYLAKYDSPLQYHAQDFIDAANQYDLDWKLVTSIAGVESTFGKHIPGGYNGWGWGVYRNQTIYFKSWKEGIFTVSKDLRENYVNRGYTEPYAMNKIYAASPAWGRKVTYFMNDLEKFAQIKYSDPLAQISLPDTRIAAVSGILAFKETLR